MCQPNANGGMSLMGKPMTPFATINPDFQAGPGDFFSKLANGSGNASSNLSLLGKPMTNFATVNPNFTPGPGRNFFNNISNGTYSNPAAAQAPTVALANGVKPLSPLINSFIQKPQSGYEIVG